MKRLSRFLALLALHLVAAPEAKAQKAASPKAKATAPGPAKAPPAAPEAGAGGAPDAAPGVKVERGAGGKKIYRIVEGIQITGKIQKPEAFYVLQNSGINYEWTELKQDFLPKILESVSKAPF